MNNACPECGMTGEFIMDVEKGEREKGFHEGVRFACDVIEKTLRKNPGIPLEAF